MCHKLACKPCENLELRSLRFKSLGCAAALAANHTVLPLADRLEACQALPRLAASALQ